jgi:hypothetical protein
MFSHSHRGFSRVHEPVLILFNRFNGLDSTDERKPFKRFQVIKRSLCHRAKASV